MMVKILAGVIGTLLVATVGLAAPKVGQPAPNFSLPGNDGKTYELSKLKGKYVVLEWFNDDCPYVEKHYDETKRNMQNLQKTWAEKAKKEKKELVWLSIVSSAPGKQGHLTAAQATNLKEKERKAHMEAILLDPSGKVGKMYDAKTTPHMFVIDPAGKVQYMGAIDDKPSARLASLNGANNYVSNALTQLFEGKAVAQTSTKPYGCSVKYK